MPIKISLTGDIGSGKSTVGKILAERLNAEIYSTGVIVREMAQERGISVVEINKLMETDPNMDFEMDNRLKALSGSDKNLVIDSRMAWFFTEGTFKVYLTTDIYESAKRVFKDNRSVESFGSIEATVLQIKKRKSSENARYLKLYGADCGFMGNFDLVIDTTATSAETVAEKILLSLEEFTGISVEEKIKFFLFGGRLKPTVEISKEEAADVKGKSEPFAETVSLVFYEGEYYIADKNSHFETLRKYYCGDNLIPCKVDFEKKITPDNELFARWDELLK